MQPWANRSDMQEAEEASARARARIAELERELEEITKKALMSSSKCLKTAKQMAACIKLELSISITLLASYPAEYIFNEWTNTYATDSGSVYRKIWYFWKRLCVVRTNK